MDPRPRILYVDHLCGETSHHLFMDSLKSIDITVVSSVLEALSHMNLADQSQKLFDILILSNPYSAGLLEARHPKTHALCSKSVLYCPRTGSKELFGLISLLKSANPAIHFLWHHRQLPLPGALSEENWLCSNSESSLRTVLYDLLDIEIPLKNRGNNLAGVSAAMQLLDEDYIEEQRRKKENQQFMERMVVANKYRQERELRDEGRFSVPEESMPVLVASNADQVAVSQGCESDEDPDLPF